MNEYLIITYNEYCTPKNQHRVVTASDPLQAIYACGVCYSDITEIRRLT